MNLLPEDSEWLIRPSLCLTETDQARSILPISVRVILGDLNILVGVYDVSMNPEFIEGRKTKE